MTSEKEVRAALPLQIPYYSFHGDRVAYNGDGRATPGKSYLDPQDVLIRVYNSTIAKEAGFSGEVVALGSHVDSFGVNDYVFGGGVPALQQYITVRAEDVTTKPRDLCFADASRLHAATLVYEHLKDLQQDLTVLILGDMTGFAAQICREKGCFVTSSEDFDCGEQSIIDSDNFLEWLENHEFVYDVVVDATGDTDLYDYCHKFTTKRAHYISINPESLLQATKTALLPRFLGGGTRKVTVVRGARGNKKVQLLSELASKVVREEYEVKNPRIVSYRSVHTVNPSQRYVTAVNVIEQKDITPEDPEYNVREGRTRDTRNKGKGKEKARPRARATSHYRSPTVPESVRYRSYSSGSMEIMASTSRPQSSPSSPVVHPYSPRVSSRLAHSISASALPDNSPPPSVSRFDESASASAPMGGIRKASTMPDPRGSPKMSIVSRPSPRPKTTSTMNDDTPFEQIELQSLMKSSAVEDDSDEEYEPEQPLPRQNLSRPPVYMNDKSDQPNDESVAVSEPESEGSSADETSAVPRKQELESAYRYAHEDADVPPISIDEETSKAAELRNAQQQIEMLQKQVDLLLKSQGKSAELKEAGGLGLVEI